MSDVSVFEDAATPFLVTDVFWSRPKHITASSIESALSQYCADLEVGAIPFRIQVFELANPREFRSVVPEPVLEEVVYD